jgi:hypothetical protein
MKRYDSRCLRLVATMTIDRLLRVRSRRTRQCIDPTKVGQRLLEEYATNKSGTLTREEFMVLADLIMRHYEEGYARTVTKLPGYLWCD